MYPVGTYSLRLKRVVLTTLTLLTIGCSDSEPEPQYNIPLDASNVTTSDAGSTGLDAGTTITADGSASSLDSGGAQPNGDAGPSALMDSALPAADAASDAAVPFDGSALGDAQSSDGSTLADGSLGDAALGDAAWGDAALGDAALGDAAWGDAALGDAQVPRMDLGKGNGSDVVMIGDSWLSNTLDLLFLNTGGGIAPALQNVSRQPYRNYAVQGVMLLQADSFGPAIPTQWDQAVRANRNIKTVVMTGGGNDIIQGSSALQQSCRQGTALCTETLEKIGSTLASTWTKMSEAGVQDIIYILYAKAANEGRLKDGDSNNANVTQLCSKVPPPARCFTVNTDTLVGDNGLALDGIHPNASANARVAKAIHDLMIKEGMRR